MGTQRVVTIYLHVAPSTCRHTISPCCEVPPGPYV